MKMLVNVVRPIVLSFAACELCQNECKEWARLRIRSQMPIILSCYAKGGRACCANVCHFVWHMLLVIKPVFIGSVWGLFQKRANLLDDELSVGLDLPLGVEEE
jgi:hypothetical protein